MSPLTLSLALGVTALSAALAVPSQAESLSLEQAVLLSRHGVRSPTLSNEELAQFSKDSWPLWEVGEGQITSHGEALLEHMGQYYREYFSDKGIISNSSCISPEIVTVWTSTKSRAIASGEAILKGLSPGCEHHVKHIEPTSSPDPLFHPDDAGTCPYDPKAAKAEILSRLGPQGLNGFIQSKRQAFDKLQDILKFDQSPLALSGKTPQVFAEMGSDIKISEAESGLKLKGPLKTASTLTEAFLLEHADGKDKGDVAWGRINSKEEWKELLELHNAEFNLLAHTPSIAKQRASQLLYQISGLFNQETTRTRVLGLRAPIGTRLYLLVGHDTNIAALGGLLKMQWTLEDQPDNTPPGGALAFELLRNEQTGERFVRAVYFYQTLEQMREGTPLSLGAPPKQTEIKIPGCASENNSSLCPLQEFQTLAKTLVDPSCLNSAQ